MLGQQPSGPAAPYRLQVFDYTGDGVSGLNVSLSPNINPDIAVVRSKFSNRVSVYKVKPGIGVGDWHAANESAALGLGDTRYLNGIIDMGPGYLTLGDLPDVNNSGEDYYGYAFERTAATDTLVMGGYAGDGNYPHYVTGVGFEPQMVFLMQDTFAAEGDVFNVPDSSLTIPTANYSCLANLLLDPDGFHVSRAGYNEIGARYLWMAWQDTLGVCGYVQGNIAGNSTVSTDPGVTCDVVWHGDRVNANHTYCRVSNYESGGQPYSSGIRNTAAITNSIRWFVDGGYDVGNHTSVTSWSGGFWWTEQGL